MNCPKCKNGVMEKLGLISLESKVKLQLITDNENEIGIEVFVCSFDQCGHSELKATPGTLSQAKRKMRERMHKEMLLQPSAVISLPQQVKI